MGMNKVRAEAAHVRIYFYMLESPAWKVISCSARVVFIELLHEWRGKDPNKIKLPYATLNKRLGMSPATISNAFLQLEHFGFITRKCGGGLYREASVYALCNDWQKIKDDPVQLNEVRSRIEKDRSSRQKNNRRSSGRGVVPRHKCGTPLPGNYKDSQELTLKESPSSATTRSVIDLPTPITEVEQGQK